jgi:hypothetical protein
VRKSRGRSFSSGSQHSLQLGGRVWRGYIRYVSPMPRTRFLLVSNVFVVTILFRPKGYRLLTMKTGRSRPSTHSRSCKCAQHIGKLAIQLYVSTIILIPPTQSMNPTNIPSLQCRFHSAHRLRKYRMANLHHLRLHKRRHRAACILPLSRNSISLPRGSRCPLPHGQRSARKPMAQRGPYLQDGTSLVRQERRGTIRLRKERMARALPTNIQQWKQLNEQRLRIGTGR